jgi:hypothetical protein
MRLAGEIPTQRRCESIQERPQGGGFVSTKGKLVSGGIRDTEISEQAPNASLCIEPNVWLDGLAVGTGFDHCEQAVVSDTEYATAQQAAHKDRIGVKEGPAPIHGQHDHAAGLKDSADFAHDCINVRDVVQHTEGVNSVEISAWIRDRGCVGSAQNDWDSSEGEVLGGEIKVFVSDVDSMALGSRFTELSEVRTMADANLKDAFPGELIKAEVIKLPRLLPVSLALYGEKVIQRGVHAINSPTRIGGPLCLSMFSRFSKVHRDQMKPRTKGSLAWMRRSARRKSKRMGSNV